MQEEIRCKKCHRYLGMAHGTIVATLKCSNSRCKADVQVKIISSDRLKDIKHKFAKVDNS